MSLNLESFSFHLISLHRGFSWKLLIASHCYRSLCHPISSQLISCLFSFFPPHLISSHLMSSLPFSALLSWSQLFSSLLISPELLSSLLISSKLNSNFHSSSQLFSALRSSGQLILCLLISSFLFSHLLLLSSPGTSSADLSSWLVSSSHLISALLSALSNHLSSSLAQGLLQKRIWAPKHATPTLSTEKIWHREAFTHSKLLHREACTHRSFYTETGTLLHREGERLLTASFYTQQVFIQRNPYTEKFVRREAFKTQQTFTHRNFYREDFTQRSFYKQQTFTQRNPCTKKMYTEKLLTHRKLLDTEAFTERRFCT